MVHMLMLDIPNKQMVPILIYFITAPTLRLYD